MPIDAPTPKSLYSRSKHEVDRMIVFRCLNGTAPVYLADSITRAADVDTRRSLRLHSSSSTAVVVPVTLLVAARSGIALTRSLLPAHGTAYRRLSRQRRLSGDT